MPLTKENNPRHTASESTNAVEAEMTHITSGVAHVLFLENYLAGRAVEGRDIVDLTKRSETDLTFDLLKKTLDQSVLNHFKQDQKGAGGLRHTLEYVAKTQNGIYEWIDDGNYTLKKKDRDERDHVLGVLGIDLQMLSYPD